MRKLVILVSVVVLALAFVMAAPAFAAKGGQGKGGGNGGGGGKGGGHGKPDRGTGDSSLTLVVVTDANEDGLPNWGDQVSFDVSTTATSEPHVNLTCSQNGVVVYGAATGYFEGYPWPWTQVMTLSSTAWSGGAADCTARLHYFSGTNDIDLASIGFTAGAQAP